MARYPVLLLNHYKGGSLVARTVAPCAGFIEDLASLAEQGEHLAFSIMQVSPETFDKVNREGSLGFSPSEELPE